jgi:hypothetical protein
MSTPQKGFIAFFIGSFQTLATPSSLAPERIIERGQSHFAWVSNLQAKLMKKRTF